MAWDADLPHPKLAILFNYQHLAEQLDMRFINVVPSFGAKHKKQNGGKEYESYIFRN